VHSSILSYILSLIHWHHPIERLEKEEGEKEEKEEGDEDEEEDDRRAEEAGYLSACEAAQPSVEVALASSMTC